MLEEKRVGPCLITNTRIDHIGLAARHATCWSIRRKVCSRTIDPDRRRKIKVKRAFRPRTSIFRSSHIDLGATWRASKYRCSRTLSACRLQRADLQCRRSLAQLRFPLAGKRRDGRSLPAYDLDPVPTDLKPRQRGSEPGRFFAAPSGSVVVDLGADLRRRDSMTDRAVLHSFVQHAVAQITYWPEMVAFNDLLRIDVSLTPLQKGRDER